MIKPKLRFINGKSVRHLYRHTALANFMGQTVVKVYCGKLISLDEPIADWQHVGIIYSRDSRPTDVCESCFVSYERKHL